MIEDMVDTVGKPSEGPEPGSVAELPRFGWAYIGLNFAESKGRGIATVSNVFAFTLVRSCESSPYLFNFFSRSAYQEQERCFLLNILLSLVSICDISTTVFLTPQGLTTRFDHNTRVIARKNSL